VELKELFLLLSGIYRHPGCLNEELSNLLKIDSPSRVIRAGVYTGFVDRPLRRKMVGSNLTPLGEIFIRENSTYNTELLIKQLVTHKIFFNAFAYYLDEGEVPDKDLIHTWYCMINSEYSKDPHLERSSLTVNTWVSELTSTTLIDSDLSKQFVIELGKLQYDEFEAIILTADEPFVAADIFPNSIKIDLLMRIIGTIFKNPGMTTNELKQAMKDKVSFTQRYVQAGNCLNLLTRTVVRKTGYHYLSEYGLKFVHATPHERTILLLKSALTHPIIHFAFRYLVNSSHIVTREEIISRYSIEFDDSISDSTIVTSAGAIRLFSKEFFQYYVN